MHLGLLAGNQFADARKALEGAGSVVKEASELDGIQVEAGGATRLASLRRKIDLAEGRFRNDLAYREAKKNAAAAESFDDALRV